MQRHSNILLLDSREIVRLLIIGTFDNVTIVPSFPVAVREAKTGNYSTIIFGADEFPGAIQTFSLLGRTVGISFDKDEQPENKYGVEILWAGSPIKQIKEKLIEIETGDPDEYKPDTGLAWNQVLRYLDITLGETQLAVLELAVEGYTAKTIGEKLEKSARYVETVLEGLYKKFGVESSGRVNCRVRLAAKALRLGIVS